jgi:hypothetical protein
MSGRALEGVIMTPSKRVRNYTFFSMDLEETHRVWFQLVRKVFLPVFQGGLFDKLMKAKVEEKVKGEASEKASDEENLAFVMDGADEIIGIFENIGFEKFWEIAKKLLKVFLVDGVEHKFQIPGQPHDDYFDDKPLELYLAVTKAVQLNFAPFLRELGQENWAKWGRKIPAQRSRRGRNRRR